MKRIWEHFWEAFRGLVDRKVCLEEPIEVYTSDHWKIYIYTIYYRKRSGIHTRSPPYSSDKIAQKTVDIFLEIENEGQRVCYLGSCETRNRFHQAQNNTSVPG